MSPAPASARDRLVAAAFDLFDVRGFDETTVDDIARAAGVGRTTFFRYFGSKEAVIFPEHDELLARIAARLDAGDADSRDSAVAEAARLVLRYYIGEGDRARIRYRLISSVPVLKTREIASIRQYQSLFARALSSWAPGDPDAVLRAELLASAIVTAHNHVLRRWLRGEVDDPEQAFAHAMSVVLEPGPHDTSETTVVVVRTGSAPDRVAAAVERALRGR
ncbi:MAG: TetR family transcriptional regulator [Aeromicrobium sp.]